MAIFLFAVFASLLMLAACSMVGTHGGPMQAVGQAVGARMCTETITEHLQWWQSALLAIGVTMVVVRLLFSAERSIALSRHSVDRLPSALDRLTLTRSIKLFDPLHLAFADGLVGAKRFSDHSG